jgi:CDGSH-type Zn-finger protein
VSACLHVCVPVCLHAVVLCCMLLCHCAVVLTCVHLYSLSVILLPRCGYTGKGPFCDGSHNKVPAAKEQNFKPVWYKADETKRVKFCACKRTKTPPFCDGSHVKAGMNAAQNTMLMPLIIAVVGSTIFFVAKFVTWARKDPVAAHRKQLDAKLKRTKARKRKRVFQPESA